MTGHKVATSVYYTVFVALLILLGLTVGTAFLDIGGWGVILAMTIAGTKALLILLYFMHLRYSDNLVQVFAGASFFWLLILIVLTVSDYIARGDQWPAAFIIFGPG